MRLRIPVAWAKEAIESLKSLYRWIRDRAWAYWCWGLGLRWHFQLILQNRFGRAAKLFLVAGSGWILLELALVTLGLLTGEHEAAGAENAGVLSDLVSWLVALAPELDVPLWLEATLVVLAGLVFVHHWHEWKNRKRQSAAPAEFIKLMNDTRTFRNSKTLADGDKTKFFETTMAAIERILKVERKKQTISISMTAVRGDANELAVVEVYPPKTEEIKQQYRLTISDSAAGTSYHAGRPIYVPSTRHQFGIWIDTWETIGLVYNRKTPVDPGPSLMCIPIFKDSQVVAVLNISSSRRNVFGPPDFQIVGFAAALFEEVN